MNISRNQTKQLQGLAILFMLGLHLFNRADFVEVFDTHINVMGRPFLFYISYIFDACVPIYLFCSGYGAGYKYVNLGNCISDRIIRLKPFILKYWGIIIATCVVGYFLGMKDQYPGTAIKFLQSIFLIRNNYVGALWFVQIYVLLTLLSNWIFSFLHSKHLKFTVMGSLLLYVFAFFMEYRILPLVHTEWSNSMLYTLMLLLRSQFMYTIGMLFAVQPLKKGEEICEFLKKQGIIKVAILIMVILLRGVFAHLIFAPFSALMLIILFICTENRIMSAILDYFGKHSTNIWMVHMQLYMLFAQKYIFWTRNPLLVYGTLLLSSLVLSYVIEKILYFVSRINYHLKESFLRICRY